MTRSGSRGSTWRLQWCSRRTTSCASVRVVSACVCVLSPCIGAHTPTLCYTVAATNKLLYIFEPFPMVDTLTVVPVFLEFAGDSVLRLDFLRMVRFLRVIRIFRIFKLLRVLRMYRVLRLSDDGITRQVMTMVWTLISIVFCAAGLIQIVGAWWASVRRLCSGCRTSDTCCGAVCAAVQRTSLMDKK